MMLFVDEEDEDQDGKGRRTACLGASEIFGWL